jgi:hypothetical protein
VPKSSIAISSPSSLSAQALDRQFRLDHGHALGDLQHEPRRIKAGPSQHPVDIADEAQVVELASGNVDRYEWSVAPALGRAASSGRLLCRLAADLLEGPQADGHDLARFLRIADELARQEQLTSVAPPADERFRAHGFAAGQLEYGLVEDLELTARQRMAERHAQVQLLARRQLHPLFEYGEARLAACLRQVHRDVNVNAWFTRQRAGFDVEGVFVELLGLLFSGPVKA